MVWAVGCKVRRWKVGDEVIVHCNQDDGDDEECNGGDPLLSPSQRIWGYETPDGRKHVSGMNVCTGNPISTISKGQTIRLHGIYNVPEGHHLIDDAMAISIMYLG